MRIVKIGVAVLAAALLFAVMGCGSHAYRSCCQCGTDTPCYQPAFGHSFFNRSPQPPKEPWITPFASGCYQVSGDSSLPPPPSRKPSAPEKAKAKTEAVKRDPAKPAIVSTTISPNECEPPAPSFNAALCGPGENLGECYTLPPEQAASAPELYIPAKQDAAAKSDAAAAPAPVLPPVEPPMDPKAEPAKPEISDQAELESASSLPVPITDKDLAPPAMPAETPKAAEPETPAAAAPAAPRETAPLPPPEAAPAVPAAAPASAPAVKSVAAERDLTPSASQMREINSVADAIRSQFVSEDAGAKANAADISMPKVELPPSLD